MAENPSEVHNTLAPEILRRIVKETANASAALVVVESVLMGACLYATKGDKRSAAQVLEHLTLAVTERLTTYPINREKGPARG